ncbi:MAG TPA: YqgE/AlgH family protein [Verrucomicrobiae bacterium]|nr:YqgE/AlgH family protein [Verrucomicrobiae bacterium]
MPGTQKYLKGQLLLDSGQLGGSFFQRTVVLICEHNADGAFGLVLNRAMGSKVGEMLVADLPDSLKESPLYLGGPVQPTTLSFLHSDAFIPDGNTLSDFSPEGNSSGSIIPNLVLGHSLEELVDIGESFSTTRKLKMFAGYSGWSPGQLEDELKREAWLVHPASVELIFETHPDDLWKTILRKKGWKYKLLLQTPEDLSSN